MNGSPVVPRLRSADWLLPDRPTDAGAEFAVEWQVVEAMQPFLPPPVVDGRNLS